MECTVLKQEMVFKRILVQFQRNVSQRISVIKETAVTFLNYFMKHRH
jgi:hypothetical protein